MNKLHTHYDNLKVMRDAPIEVIRAAYRSLSQKYHPDRNPGDDNAAKAMSVINVAYAALSDPDQRRAHDEWISQQERLRAHSSYSSGAAPHASASSTGNPDVTRPRPGTAPHEPRGSAPKFRPPRLFRPEVILKAILLVAIRAWPLTLIAAVFIFSKFSDPPTPPRGPAPYTSSVMDLSGSTSPQDAVAPIERSDAAGTPANRPDLAYAPAPTAASMPSRASDAYVRSELAPNGEPWPRGAGYLRGEPRLNGGGLSEVTVDNGQNDADVYVKLVAISEANAHPVREFFIPAHSRFTVHKIDAGRYDVRYRDLDTGHLARAEEFQLEEIPTPNGTQYSSVELTLYKVANGNMQTYDLAEDEF